jgi:putative transposase
MRPARRRRLVDEVRADWKVSIRRACATFRIDTSLYHYKSKRGEQADLKARIREIAQTRVRYGYRRVHVLLRREGWVAIRSESIAFTRRWVFSCGTRRRSVG